MHWLGKRAAILIIAGVIGVYPQKVAGKTPEVNEAVAANTTEARIENTASIITVKIKRKSGSSDKEAFAGTGFIVSLYESDKNTYYVLTSKHVVILKDTYEVVTPDGKAHQVEYSNIVLADGDVDLAMLRFTSDKDYVRTCVGNSDALSIGSPVYLYGWVKSGQSAKKKKLSKGAIIEIINGQTQREGYSLIYSNEAFNGMSGGPLLSADACVVGIHGRRRPYPSLGEGYLGISINKGQSLLEAYQPKYSLEPPDNLWVAEQEKKRAEEQAKTAALPKEWRSVLSRWEMAIALLEEVPENHPNYRKTRKLTRKYRKELNNAREDLEESEAEIYQRVPEIIRTALNEKLKAEIAWREAKLPGQWREVESNWCSAIELLEQVPESHPEYEDTQEEISQERQNLEYIQGMLKQSQEMAPEAAPDPYFMAIMEGKEANRLMLSLPRTREEWIEIAERFQTAINLLKKLPANHPRYLDAQRIILEYRENIQKAKKRQRFW